jgi:hypothetical protein
MIMRGFDGSMRDGQGWWTKAGQMRQAAYESTILPFSQVLTNVHLSSQ